MRRDSGGFTFLAQEGEFTPTTTDKAINSGIIFHCSEEKIRNRKCLEESLTKNAFCTSNVQLLDQTEKALHGTLSNERLFCNEVNLNTVSLDDDIQTLVDCQPEFFDEAENCARPFRDNFKTTAAAERISDQTCRFVLLEVSAGAERARGKDDAGYVISGPYLRVLEISAQTRVLCYSNANFTLIMINAVERNWQCSLQKPA